MTENWRHTHTHTCSRWDPTDEHVTHSSSWTSASTLDEHWESFTGNLQYFWFPKEPFRTFSLYKEDSVRWKDSTDANKEALFVCVCVCEVKLDSAVTNIWPQHTADGSLREKLTWFSLKIQIHTAPASLQSADRHRNTSASNWDVLRKLTLSV